MVKCQSLTTTNVHSHQSCFCQIVQPFRCKVLKGIDYCVVHPFKVIDSITLQSIILQSSVHQYAFGQKYYGVRKLCHDLQPAIATLQHNSSYICINIYSNCIILQECCMKNIYTSFPLSLNTMSKFCTFSKHLHVSNVPEINFKLQ